MINIAKLPSNDRRALFTNTANQTGLTVAIIEKDFWVCWVLDYLFSRCRWKHGLAFKGGTSLTKAYNLIERFSEDIDLVLDWRTLGYSLNEPWETRSNTKQDRFNSEANEKAIIFLKDVFAPSLRDDFQIELGANIRVEPDDTDGQTILFSYPQEFSDSTILQDIRLEVGPLAAWTPTETKEITPYAAEHFDHLFVKSNTSVLTVLPERTFWEKITILHREANRPNSSSMPLRYSRHYYDLYCMSTSWVKEKTLNDVDLLNRVVMFKEKFYRSTWAGYEYAKRGSMKLMPPKHSIKVLEDDYLRMQRMIFGEKPSFDVLMESIKDLEDEINQF